MRLVDIGEATEPTPDGNIVRVTPKTVEPRRVDRTVAKVAVANDGRYTIDLYLKHDPRATEHTPRLMCGGSKPSAALPAALPASPAATPVSAGRCVRPRRTVGNG